MNFKITFFLLLSVFAFSFAQDDKDDSNPIEGRTFGLLGGSVIFELLIF